MSVQPCKGVNPDLAYIPLPRWPSRASPGTRPVEEGESQAFGQGWCLAIPSPCKVFINQDGFWLIAAALRAGLSQQSRTIVFRSFAEEEPLYVRVSACLPLSKHFYQYSLEML